MILVLLVFALVEEIVLLRIESIEF